MISQVRLEIFRNFIAFPEAWCKSSQLIKAGKGNSLEKLAEAQPGKGV